jgi:transcription initiation factor TFIID subunit TAF12
MAAKTGVETALGLMPKPAAPGAQQQQQKPAERPASPRPATAAHALGAMPAAAAPEVGRGEFTHLDNLNGLDLERAVAALSPEQRERWAAES